MVQPVLRLMMSAGIVEHQPDCKPAQVHGHSGRPLWPVCTLFTPAHKANADGKAAM